MKDLVEELNLLKEKNLLRKLKRVESAQGVRIILNGREVINLCSNDYLGLASDERLKEAMISAVKRDGVGAAAARLISGNMRAHEELEEKIREFKKAEKALLFNSGYVANIGVISAITKREQIVLSDRLNHASIVDGILLSGANFIRYPHCDTSKLKVLLEQYKEKDKLIITDAIFSMDGDIAPLPEILELAEKYKADIYIDEAHATGILGKEGRGIFEYFGIEDKKNNINNIHIIQMGTLSKAVGVFGGFVCAKRTLIDYLINKARAFIFTTALPPAVCAAASVAIDIIKKEKNLREKLWKNTNFFKEKLEEMGFNTLNTKSPIIPILIGDEEKTIRVSKRLEEEGIYVAGIRYPTVERNKARLRVSITAKHTKDELEYVLDVLKKIKKEMNI